MKLRSQGIRRLFWTLILTVIVHNFARIICAILSDTKGIFKHIFPVMVLILTPLFTKDTLSHRRLILRLTHPIFFPSSSFLYSSSLPFDILISLFVFCTYLLPLIHSSFPPSSLHFHLSMSSFFHVFCLLPPHFPASVSGTGIASNAISCHSIGPQRHRPDTPHLSLICPALIPCLSLSLRLYICVCLSLSVSLLLTHTHT